MSDAAKILTLYHRIHDLQSVDRDNGLDQTVSDLSYEIAQLRPDAAVPLYSALTVALLERIE